MVRWPDFRLERWFARYEFSVEYNLAASCPWPTTTAELLSLAGDKAREEYLSLDLGYIPSPGTPSLRETLAATYATVTPGEVQVTTGASEAICLLLSQLLEPGDAIVVQTPIYQSFLSVAESVGAEVRRWPLRPDTGWSCDVEQLDDLLDERVRMVVINSPNSPTGAMLGRDELQEVVRRIERLGVYLVVDEVYRGVSLSGQVQAPSPVDASERAIVIGDITKPYGLGGLRVGWLVCKDRAILQRIAKARDYTTMCSAAPSEFLAEIALRYSQAIIAKKVEGARANLEALRAFAVQWEGVLEWNDPKGGYTIFAKLATPLETEAFCRRLAEEYGTLLLPGSVFDHDSYVRIGLGARPSEFAMGLERLAQFLTSLKA